MPFSAPERVLDTGGSWWLEEKITPNFEIHLFGYLNNLNLATAASLSWHKTFVYLNVTGRGHVLTHPEVFSHYISVKQQKPVNSGLKKMSSASKGPGFWLRFRQEPGTEMSSGTFMVV